MAGATAEDLIAAAVDVGSASGRGDVAAARYEAIREELGVGPILGPDVEMDLLPVSLIVNTLAGITDPFAGVLEGPESVTRIYRRHAKTIRAAADRHIDALYTAAVDALAEACPGIAMRHDSKL